MAEQKLQLVIEAVDKTKAAFESTKGGLDGLSKKAEALAPTFKKMAAVGTVAFTAITAEIGVAIKSFAESQAQLARVDATLANMSTKTLKQFGGDMELAKTITREFGAEMQKLGGIGDETASEGFAKLLLVTEDSTKAMEAAELAADLATYKQIDYLTAVDIVGKVVSGNTGILAKYGIQLKENATTEEAMAALSGRVAGQYEAYGKTVEGQMAILKQSMGDIQENIGAAFLPILQQLLDKLSPIIQSVVDWTNAHPELAKNLLIAGVAVAGLITIVGVLGMAIPGIIAGFSALGAVLTFLAANPIVILLGVLAALLVAIHKQAEAVGGLKEYFRQTWEGIGIIVKEWVDKIIAFLQPIIDAFNRVRDAVSNAFSSVGNFSRSVGNKVSGFLGFDDGGVVPGAIGQPQLALVHGGETILPTHKQGFSLGGGINLTITGNTFLGREDIAEQIGDDIIKVLQRTYKF